MNSLLAAFVVVAINPFGGLFLAVPLAIFELQWSPALAVAIAVPLSYVQVLAVDLGWDSLQRWEGLMRFVEKKRSDRLESALRARWAPVWITLMSPWIGPWLVMAVMRFGKMPRGRAFLPLFLGLAWVGTLTGVVCVYAPDLIPAREP